MEVSIIEINQLLTKYVNLLGRSASQGLRSSTKRRANSNQSMLLQRYILLKNLLKLMWMGISASELQKP